MTTFLNDGLELLLRLWSEHCGTGLQVIHDDRGGVEIRVREVMRVRVREKVWFRDLININRWGLGLGLKLG